MSPAVSVAKAKPALAAGAMVNGGEGGDIGIAVGVVPVFLRLPELEEPLLYTHYEVHGSYLPTLQRNALFFSDFAEISVSSYPLASADFFAPAFEFRDRNWIVSTNSFVSTFWKVGKYISFGIIMYIPECIFLELLRHILPFYETYLFSKPTWFSSILFFVEVSYSILILHLVTLSSFRKDCHETSRFVCYMYLNNERKCT